MRVGLAFLAGVIGGAVMILLMMVARAAGMTEMNLAMVLGSMITRETTAGTWALGFVMHLVISGLIALIYAAVFEAIRRSNWFLGLIGGAIHAVIGGVLFGYLPPIHPLIPDVIAAPGAFAVNYGMPTAVAFVVLHLMYGMIVGGMYSPVNVPKLTTAEPTHLPEEHAVGTDTERRRPEDRSGRRP
jgi:hypothetical protein